MRSTTTKHKVSGIPFSDKTPASTMSDSENEDNLSLVSRDVLLASPEEDFNSFDDDPLAEGDEPRPPKPPPSTKIASGFQFHRIANALESLDKVGRNKKRRVTVEQKLKFLLPLKMFELLDGHDPPESIFPLFRLLMPDKDGSRFWKMAESTIATTYSGALDLSKDSSKTQKLYNFTDPNVVSPSEGRGDLSSVVRHVVSKTKSVQVPSTWTVGEINDALDTLCKLPEQAKSQRASNHDWRDNTADTEVKPKKRTTLKELRIQWLKHLCKDQPEKGRVGLSPLEHKWLVRILLRKLNCGLGFKPMLTWYNAMGPTLFTSHSSLRAVCDRLCDPELEGAKTDHQDGRFDDAEGLDSYQRKSLASPEFGKIFSPMVSERTGFDRILHEISHRHRDYIVSEGARKLGSHVQPDSLAFMHPTFCVEPKLDGERMMVHISRDGVVKMHTRNGNWYSLLYSPSLGPPLRRAMKRPFDVILDGEVIAWDSGRRETVPFGNNRTIANMRKKYLRSRGMLDKRDENIPHDDDAQVISANFFSSFDKAGAGAEMVGEECWLQLILFDILYLDGDSADEFLASVVSPNKLNQLKKGGALIDLELMERKKVLYSLIQPQKDEVEVIQTFVIRPNGKSVAGDKYFDVEHPQMECGHPLYELDSLKTTLEGKIEDLPELDVRRRHGKSDDQISHARAYTVQTLFYQLVEQQRLEGLLFKDLSAPYFLGEQSRGLRYWHKFKPDYFNGSDASDLDVVIIGGYFATGLKNAGQPSGALCACVDSEDPESFYPLVKVNLGSRDLKTRAQFLRETGYKYQNQKDKYDDDEYEDKWFRLDRDSREMPDFVSKKSSPSDTGNNGWNVPKKDYPDIWIHPKDSFVITLNAGEIVDSDTFSAGLTLRFPRIVKFRFGADRKNPSDIESERSLWNIYCEVTESRSSFNSQQVSLGSPALNSVGDKPLRFLTEKQYLETKKNRKRTKTAKQLVRVAVPEVSSVSSKALAGVVFAVLGTSFRLLDGSIDAQEAMEQGWLEEGRQVKNAASVIKFIKKHGGTYKISPDDTCNFVLGGKAHDPRVSTHIRAIEGAAARLVPGKKNKTKVAKLNEKMAQLPGVIRWTFVFSLVHRWRAKNGGDDVAIIDTDPDFLKATFLDYLAKPKTAALSTNAIDPGIFEMDISHVSTMRRAVDSVGMQDAIGLIATNWRDDCMTRLPIEERWVVSCDLQSLWPYHKDETPDPACILYPDVFDSDLGDPMNDDGGSNNDSRWESVSTSTQASRITSVLPLARAMGCFVDSRLHRGVTHVLCHLKDDETDEVEFSEDLSASFFQDASRGEAILERLREIRNGSSNDKVLIVAPRWLRKRKWPA